MGSWSSWRRGSALAFCVLFANVRVFAGGLDLVIDEDFEDGIPADVGIVNSGAGDVQVRDDGSGENLVLSLTQAVNNQGGHIWFPDQFDLSSKRVEIEFDLFLGRGTTATPADGAAVIIQFDADLAAIGDLGGGLGIQNLRSPAGESYEYIALAFDIWDNGAADIERPCDANQGPNSTASVKVFQNRANLFNAPPDAEGESPDYITSAEIYGSPEAGQHTGDESFDRDDLVHVHMIFDAGALRVRMSGASSCVAEGEEAVFFDERVVIDHFTQPFPNRPANIGFSASTGGANAWQWIDNLVVSEGDSIVSVVEAPPMTAGAMNCAGPEVDTAGELDVLFLEDVPAGSEVSREGDIDTGLVITTSRFGRVLGGSDFIASHERAIDVLELPNAGTAMEEILRSVAWSTSKVHYQAPVEPGRYDVTLYWAEDCTCARGPNGEGTKIFDVYLGEERVLCNWSAASYAGTGSGDPNVSCSAVLDKGIALRYSVEVADTGDGAGLLEILVDDLGAGNPPENATLGAFQFARSGDVTGRPASGDIECIQKDPAEAAPGVLVEDSFDDANDGDCPAGWQCNGDNYTPQIAGGRLKITDDAIGNTAATTFLNEAIDVCGYAMRVEFDLFMGNPDGAGDPRTGGAEAADGAAFFVRSGSDTDLLGPAGGGLGIPGGVPGFIVEFDTWDGGAAHNDPSGFNNGTAAFTHVGIGSLTVVSEINSVQFNPDHRPIAYGGTGWPDFFHEDGVHVIVEYDTGHVRVTLEGTTAEGDIFGPEVVAEADVFPIQSTTAVAGFSGGTGGRTQDTEIDNFELEAAEASGPGFTLVDQAFEDALERWNGGAGELYINCGGSLLLCTADQIPAPGATGDDDVGERVVWLGDLVGGGLPEAAANEFFTVQPILNGDGTNTGLQVATTNMGLWDARGTTLGVDDNDRIFHTERWGDHGYEIPIDDPALYEVTLYFANSFSGTAGNGRRFFHVVLEGEQQTGFEHCEFVAPGGFDDIPNPIAEFDNLFDPVEAAEHNYSRDPCNYAPCEGNGVAVMDNPDLDPLDAQQECGNAASSALRYEVAVTDGAISIAVTEPDVAAGEPESPDMSPKISGIAIRYLDEFRDEAGFVRGNADGLGGLELTDAIFLFNWLFLGGAEPGCLKRRMRAIRVRST